MLTAMTDEDWTIVLQVFAASRSADVQFHRSARPRLGGGRKGGSMIRRLAARVAVSLLRFI